MFQYIEDALPPQQGSTFSLMDHQEEALENLAKMREENQTIALLYHATGAGKTVTAVSDVKSVGKRALFLAHRHELLEQAANAFKKIWPEVTVGRYEGSVKETDTFVICGSIQSVAQNLEDFSPDDFGYLVIDECHHGTAETYRKIMSYFHPSFTLGLTATPERMDGEDLLEIFQNVAHKLDLRSAVELGTLVPVRCIRIKTNIDMRDVRISGFKYNTQDLESTIEQSGKTCTCSILTDEEYLEHLDKKLNEELTEYQESKSMEELADLLEVMRAVAVARGSSPEEVEHIRKEKAEKRGGFEKRILLEEVLEPE